MIVDDKTGMSADITYRRCAFAHCASNMMKRYADLYIDPKKMSEIIGEKMDDEVSECLYDPNDDGMDTCVREQVFDLVSNHYIGQEWPCNCDQVDFKKFANDLVSAIEDAK